MNTIGDVWHPIDLHVHTPVSHETEYGNSADSETWATFISNLEKLPGQNLVVGINDYWSIDGYERILADQKAGRLKNIKTLLPVVEMRLEDAAGGQSPINYHIVFNPDLPTCLIRSEFVEQLRCEYETSSGLERFRYTEADIIRYGEFLQDNKGEGVPCKPFKLGRDNFKVKRELVQSLLEDSRFKNNYLTAIGAAEWNALRHGGNLGVKKNVIDNANLVLIASETEDQYRRTLKKVRDFNKAIPVLHASDAHRYDDGKEKTRFLGASRMWMRSNGSFEGIRYALSCPTRRLHFGEPPELKTKNNANILVKISVNSSKPTLNFKYEFPLNPGYVACIGHKGQGKSAFVDWIAYGGGAKIDENYYSFLNKNRFSYSSNKNYIVDQLWQDNKKISRTWGKNYPAEGHRIEYFPQRYMEALCSADPGSEGAEELQRLVYRIIYRALPDQKGAKTLEEYFDRYNTNQSDEAHRSEVNTLASELEKVNRRLGLLNHYNLEERIERISSDIEELEREAGLDDCEGADEVSRKTEFLSKASRNLQAELDALHGIAELWASLASARRRLSESNQLIRDKKYESREQITQYSADLGELLDRAVDPLVDVIESTVANLDEAIFRLKTVSSAHGVDLHDRRNVLNELTSEFEAQKSTNTDYNDLQRTIESLKNGPTDPDTDMWSLTGISALLEEREQTKATKERIEKNLVSRSKSILVSLNERMCNYKSILETDIKPLLGEDSQIGLLPTISLGPIIQNFTEIVKNNSPVFTSNIQNLEAAVDGLLDGGTILTEEPLDKYFRLVLSILGQAQQLMPNGVFKVGKKFSDLADCLLSFKAATPAINPGLQDTPLIKLSPGQRGLVLLLFVLYLDRSENVLIIDQPEDNLDNDTIRRLVVPALHRARMRRQIIVVTHNANIGVLGDPDQVIYWDFDQQSFAPEAGSLNCPNIKQRAITTLEGAEAAFRARSERYGLGNQN